MNGPDPAPEVVGDCAPRGECAVAPIFVPGDPVVERARKHIEVAVAVQVRRMRGQGAQGSVIECERAGESPLRRNGGRSHRAVPRGRPGARAVLGPHRHRVRHKRAHLDGACGCRFLDRAAQPRATADRRRRGDIADLRVPAAFA